MRQRGRLTTKDMERGTYRGKRILDVSLAVAACIAFAPIVTVIMLAIWLEDRGSPFFAQTRVGRRRKTFRILKFRTMRAGVVTRVTRGRPLACCTPWSRKSSAASHARAAWSVC